MKKAIIPILMAILLIATAFAQSPPVPRQVRGYLTINDQGTTGYIIEAQNIRTGEILSGEDKRSMVSEPAGFFFDLGDFKKGYEPKNPFFGYPGDPIEVRVRGFEEGKAKFTDTPSFPFEVRIKIATQDSSKYYVCWDLSVVAAANLCPAQPVAPQPTPSYTCSEGTKVESKDQCPVEAKEHADKTVIAIVAAGGVAALGFAGLYLYYRRKGKIAQAEKMAATYIKNRKK